MTIYMRRLRATITDCLETRVMDSVSTGAYLCHDVARSIRPAPATITDATAAIEHILYQCSEGTINSTTMYRRLRILIVTSSRRIAAAIAGDVPRLRRIMPPAA